MEARIGLDNAYGLDSGVNVDSDTMFAAGSKTLHDIWDNLKIPLGLVTLSQRYGEADKVLDASPQIRRVVGHGLGGAVARELQKSRPQLKLQTETYSAPALSLSGPTQRHRHWLDPVAIFDWGMQTTLQEGLNHHSCQALAQTKTHV